MSRATAVKLRWNPRRPARLGGGLAGTLARFYPTAGTLGLDDEAFWEPLYRSPIGLDPDELLRAAAAEVSA